MRGIETHGTGMYLNVLPDDRSAKIESKPSSRPDLFPQPLQEAPWTLEA